jgi:hypothetical protein
MIITEIKVTPKKATVKFKTKSNDPFESTVTYDGPLSAEQRSHIEAVGEHIIDEAKRQMDAEDAQGKLSFDSTPTEPVEGDDVGYTDDVSQTSETQWSNSDVVYNPGADLPDFGAMEKGAIEWYIRKSEDKDSIREEVEYNFSKKINKKLSLEATKDKALEIIFGELKIA